MNALITWIAGDKGIHRFKPESGSSEIFFSKFHFYIIDEFSHGLLVVFLADQQGVSLFGNQITFQSLDDSQLVLGKLNDVVLAIIQQGIAVDDDIFSVSLGILSYNEFHVPMSAQPKSQACT